MTKLHLSTLWPATVGFDRFFHEVESLLNQTETTSTFPPHNIIKVSDNKYIVELAVAGFSKDEISIKTIDGILEIKGEKNNQDKDVQYLHKGIGARSFTKTIRLAETVEVQGAQFKDGILSVGLENVIPEHKKPRNIEIKDDLNFYKPEFLTE
jgi:molecular chaperone IbpA